MPNTTGPKLNAAPHGRLTNVCVEYIHPNKQPVRILDIPFLEIPAGRLLGLRGPSGSGKTTLLHLLGGLARPTKGQISWASSEISSLNEATCDSWRRTNVGFIFQDFHLIAELSVLENIVLPLLFTRLFVAQEIKDRACQLISSMGLRNPHQGISTLSRGEQQRVAIARALLHEPTILIADEPTASLDKESADGVMKLLISHAQSTGATLIVSSHDSQVLTYLNEVITLHAGRLAKGEQRK